jgi:hypothetical protein
MEISLITFYVLRALLGPHDLSPNNRYRDFEGTDLLSRHSREIAIKHSQIGQHPWHQPAFSPFFKAYPRPRAGKKSQSLTQRKAVLAVKGKTGSRLSDHRCLYAGQGRERGDWAIRAAGDLYASLL